MGTLPRCECWVFYSVTKPGKQPFLLVAIKSYFLSYFILMPRYLLTRKVLSSLVCGVFFLNLLIEN